MAMIFHIMNYQVEEIRGIYLTEILSRAIL